MFRLLSWLLPWLLSCFLWLLQALIYGDNRPFNVALVFPDWELLSSWAESKGGVKPGATKEDIASLDSVRNLIAGEIQMSLEGFKKFEVSYRYLTIVDQVRRPVNVSLAVKSVCELQNVDSLFETKRRKH